MSHSDDVYNAKIKIKKIKKIRGFETIRKPHRDTWEKEEFRNEYPSI